MSNFDLSSLALRSAFPTNSLICDDTQLPSVMVFIPKFKMSDVIDGGSDSTHPAFIVDGVEKDGIYISKYQNIVREANPYSLPGEDPATSVNFDNAFNYCATKGQGWHLMTAMEWGAISLWCKKNGHLPYGNNNNGKDTKETLRKAIPSYIDENGIVMRTATGTGPVEWSHNKQADGIYDLNGNVWEWNSGIRLLNGELQILENNNAANRVNSQSSNSTHWRAIDGTTGDLIIPNTIGSTPYSIKLDLVDGKWTWITGAISTQGEADTKFVNVASTGLCEKAKELLYALGLLPHDTGDYGTAPLHANNTINVVTPNELMLFSGGASSTGGSTGLFRRVFLYKRINGADTVGFRSAYYE